MISMVLVSMFIGVGVGGGWGFLIWLAAHHARL
jgi:hypothetical protein